MWSGWQSSLCKVTCPIGIQAPHWFQVIDHSRGILCLPKLHVRSLFVISMCIFHVCVSASVCVEARELSRMGFLFPVYWVGVSDHFCRNPEQQGPRVCSLKSILSPPQIFQLNSEIVATSSFWGVPGIGLRSSGLCRRHLNPRSPLATPPKALLLTSVPSFLRVWIWEHRCLRCHLNHQAQTTLWAV